MAYASRSGRAKTSSSNPRAHAICDRCGFRYNHVDLNWQYDWRGATKQNIRILVCNTCMDDAQEQLRAIVVPADPVPIEQPRVESFINDEVDYRITAAPPLIDPTTGIPIPQGQQRITTSGQDRITQPIGRPVGLNLSATMPLKGAVHYGEAVPVLSAIGNGSFTVTVTCSAAHGLSTNDQVAIEGMTSTAADGFYSITVTSGTAFTYFTNTEVPSGSLLGSRTLIWTTIVGLPYVNDQIPQTGG